MNFCDGVIHVSSSVALNFPDALTLTTFYLYLTSPRPESRAVLYHE